MTKFQLIKHKVKYFFRSIFRIDKTSILTLTLAGAY